MAVASFHSSHSLIPNLAVESRLVSVANINYFNNEKRKSKNEKLKFKLKIF